MNQHTDLEIYRRFSVLNTLEEPLFISLCKQLTIQKAHDGDQLFSEGDLDTKEYFITKGKIALTQANKTRVIEAGMPNSNLALSSHRPRQHSATCQGEIEYFTIDTAVLKQIIDKKKRSQDNLALFNQRLANNDKEALFKQFEHELNRGYFVLPSFPESAIQIKNTIENNDCEINQVVNLIQSDPGLSAKLIKTANSPLYRGVSDCNNITSAVMRLGLATTKQMAMSFAVLNLFESDSKVLNQQMENIRKKCIQVACLAYIISKNISHLEPEEAILAGLLYPIGKIIVLTYAEHFHPIDKKPGELAFLISSLQDHAGEISTQQWQFPKHLIEVASGKNLTNKPEDSLINYNELIKSCKLLSLIKMDKLEALPDAKNNNNLIKLYAVFGNKELTLKHIQSHYEQLNALKKLFIL